MRNLRLLLLTLPVAALVSCGGSSPDAKRQEAAPVGVRVATAAAAEWPALYEATGTVRARTTATLSSKVMGYVREVRVQTGDHVSRGELLIALDARDLAAAGAQAAAAVREARSAQSEVENSINAARANLNLAKVTYARMKDLFEKKSISNQEFDEATARLRVAEASYQMAVSKRGQLGAHIQQAEEGHRAARVMLGYAEIRAPFAGVVTEKKVDPGNLAAPGAPLLTVEQAGAYRLEASVDESRLPLIRVGQPVTVALESLDRSIAARVSEIVPAVDAASRSFVVKINLPASPQLRSGLFGRAQFSLGTRRVLAIPAAAVLDRGQVQSVYVVEDGHARNRLVTTGMKNQDQVEVLSGLTAADKVVAPVQANLADGAAVEVHP
jgi:membrane fusion protein, multidrug efflux system